jgi:hypothetical protein
MSSLPMVSEIAPPGLTVSMDPSFVQRTKIPDPRGTQDSSKYSVEEILRVGRDAYNLILVSYLLNSRLIYYVLHYYFQCNARKVVSHNLDNLGEAMWSKISPVQKSSMINKVGPVSFYFSLLFPTNLKLVSKHPELKTDYENAWIAEVLIKNVVVNARGNRSKGPMQQPRSFQPLPYTFHANYHLATNIHSSPSLDSVDNTHNATAHIPSPPSPSLHAHNRGNATHHGPPAHSPAEDINNGTDIMPDIPPLLRPHPTRVNNTRKIAPQIPSPPSTRVEPEPRPSSS